MGHISYHRVSSGKISSSCHGNFRGFRLNLRRIYATRLRKRLTFFLKLLHKWLSHLQALPSVKKMFRRRNGFKRNNSNSSRSGLVREEKVRGKAGDFRLRSFDRSNSFYAEAIADCLEFIKRTSVSMEQIQKPVSLIQDKNS